MFAVTISTKLIIFKLKMLDVLSKFQNNTWSVQ